MKRIIRLGSRGYLHESVSFGDTVYLCGLPPDDLSLPFIGQLEQVASKIEKALEDASTSKSRMLHATVYLTNYAHRADLNAFWRRWLSDSEAPARMTLAVADLGGPLVE